MTKVDTFKPINIDLLNLRKICKILYITCLFTKIFLFGKNWHLSHGLKIVLVQFQKKFTVPHFAEGWPKNFELLPDNSFDTGFQKIVLSSLLLFSGACY